MHIIHLLYMQTLLTVANGYLARRPESALTRRGNPGADRTDMREAHAR